jgi:hypothetical protein
VKRGRAIASEIITTRRAKRAVSNAQAQAEIEAHKCAAATLPAVLTSEDIARRQNGAYHSQKTIKVDGHLGNVRSN